MDLTTTTITGILLSVFAVTLAVRATGSRSARPTDGGFDTAPASTAIDETEHAPDQADFVEPARDLQGIYERAVARTEQAKSEVSESLVDMENARKQLSAAHEQDEFARAHWKRAYRSADLRFTRAAQRHEKAVDEIDRVRNHLRALCAHVTPTAP